MTQSRKASRVAVIGNYLPRRCGIATFTTDLCEAIAAESPETTCFAVPVNDTDAGYAYPAPVRFELQEQEVESYRRAADFLNISDLDLVCVQHEYGIYGGASGGYLLALLRELRMPVVTTLHTILRQPDPVQRRVLNQLTELSDRLVVMSQRGQHFLEEIYQAPKEKIDLIPHGIPDVPFVDPNFHKDRFGVEGKLVLLTFGLLSPNKGIENAIEALPAVLARYPNVVYLVLGATHPSLLRREGESYRLRLEKLAQVRGVEDSVVFVNQFVSLEELVACIGAADIYLTPYLNPAQIVSGTLAYSVGAGKAVISTPYWYAQELLAENRGVLVPFADPEAIAARVLELLDNETERHAMRKRAYLYGRQMIWPEVARSYLCCFERAREERTHSPRVLRAAGSGWSWPSELPAVNLSHLRRMTDDTGILQHALFCIPNYNEGYTTDDNARALLLTTLLEENGEITPAEALAMGSRYLAFLWHAFHPEEGRFRNFLSYDRRWLEPVGSEDSHGRALWALGKGVRSRFPELQGPAARLFHVALPKVVEFRSPRAWAYALIGLQEYLMQFSGDTAAQNIRQTLAERLMDLYRSQSSADRHPGGRRAGQERRLGRELKPGEEVDHKDRNTPPDPPGPPWPWFEDRLAYANATLPHALLLCAQSMGREDMADVGLRALEWLAAIQSDRGHFVPIGSNGFYKRGGERSRFDQQPIEAQAMLAACLEAYHMTSELRWRAESQRAFEWFLGRNDLRLPLYDPVTGGCRDGLHPDRANENQGAEATLTFLLALVEMRACIGAQPAEKTHELLSQPA